MGLQKFKLKTANTVISSDNASLNSMATNQILDLFSLDDSTGLGSSNREGSQSKDSEESNRSNKPSLKSLLEEMPELWDEKEYADEFDVGAFARNNSVKV